MRAPTIPVRSLNHTLPKPIGGMLGRLDRRARVASLQHGLGTTGLVVAVVGAVGMIADFLWALPAGAAWGSFERGGCGGCDHIRRHGGLGDFAASQCV